MFIEKTGYYKEATSTKVSGGCAKLVLIGHRSPTWQLNWSKIVLLACQLQERGNDFFTLRYIQRSTYTYLFSAKPISRLYSKVSCALRIVEKPLCDHDVFLGGIEVSRNLAQRLGCQAPAIVFSQRS